jgi:hypothetical protein
MANLASIFPKVVHKQIVAVELPGGISNAHELNGVSALKDFFGTHGTTKGEISWHYFADDEEPASDRGTFTFYDARAKSSHRTGRSEWRFYYYGDFLRRALVDDWVFLARTSDERLFGLVFQDGSAWLRAAQVLFGVTSTQQTFSAIGEKQLGTRQLELLHRQIFEELDLEIAVPTEATDEELMMRAWGGVFPSTAEMSAFARRHVEVDSRDPDAALLAWIDREERLFRAMEAVVIRKRLADGFASVDDFVSYSLSVQNRRKSRMGAALQNHLAEVFKRHDVRFAAQCRTEGKNKPDFIFPGLSEYHDPNFDASLLVMLGVKSSSKERWRQVLDEADRIPKKHLCTLDQGISTSQTDAMRARLLTLVVPAGLRSAYTREQSAGMLTVGDFIGHVKEKQRS